MSVLIIGGDQISQISTMLESLGAKTINHWDARKKSSAPKKKIPQDTDCILMITSFLNHNTMLKYKSEAKKKKYSIICAKRSISCVYDEYVKIMGIKDCNNCYANCTERVIMLNNNFIGFDENKEFLPNDFDEFQLIL